MELSLIQDSKIRSNNIKKTIFVYKLNRKEIPAINKE